MEICNRKVKANTVDEDAADIGIDIKLKIFDELYENKLLIHL